MNTRSRFQALSLVVVSWSFLIFAGLGMAGREAKCAEIDDNVSIELKILAQKIIEICPKNSVFRVSSFQGPSSAGPELQVKLAEELEALSAEISSIDYDIDIQGRFQQETADRGVIGVKIIAQLFEQSGRPYTRLEGTVGDEEEADLERTLFDIEATPRLLGITTNVGPGVAEPERSRRIAADDRDPPIEIVETRLIDDQRQFGIEILVKQDGQYVARALEAVGRRGLPFVPIDVEEVYAIRLLNFTPNEAAVVLSIDGLNVFHFFEGENQPQHWLVPPASGDQPGATLVRGWTVNSDDALEFRVTSYPESAVGRLKIEPNADIGQIAAQFAASWPEGAEPPQGEAGTRATGFGERIEDATTRVPRNIGNLRATLILRYER